MQHNDFGAHYFMAKKGSVNNDYKLNQIKDHDYEEPYFKPANEEEGLLIQLKKLSIPVLEEETEILTQVFTIIITL